MRRALDAIGANANRQPGKCAVVDLSSGERWSYAAFDRLIDACAEVLLSRLGDARGARVASLGRNSAETLMVQFACERIGAIFAPLNWRLATPELAVLMEDCTPALLLHQEEFSDAAQAIVPASPGAGLVTFDGTASALRKAMAEVKHHGCGRLAAYDPDRVSTLLYTSGTSGRPKGVIVTRLSAHFGLVNLCFADKVTSDSVFLCDMPLFHTVGLFAVSGTVLLAGGTVLISAGFEPVATLQRLSDPELGVTHYFCAPQMAEAMRRCPNFRDADLSRLVALCTGGAPHPKAAIEPWLDRGIPLIDGFGMSECGSAIGMPLGDLELIRRKAGSVGVPFLSVEARIVDDAGRDVRTGEAGELWIRGPNLTPGYWNRPDETARVFADDGWFRTGDVARQDADGFYYVVDRRKDMYISGGENVYPAEVEGVILEMAAVAEVAVIGIPDHNWGEVGCAFVTVAPGADLTDAEIIAHCHSRLARYKAPKTIVLGAPIPRTASGKVQKHVLRDRYMSRVARG